MRRPTEKEVEEYLEQNCPYRRLRRALNAVKEVILDDMEFILRKIIKLVKK